MEVPNSNKKLQLEPKTSFLVILLMDIELGYIIIIILILHLFTLHYNVVVLCSHRDSNLVLSICPVQPLTPSHILLAA